MIAPGRPPEIDPTEDPMEENVQEVIDTAVALVSTWGLKVIGAIAVLIIGRWVAGWIRKGIKTSLEKAKVDSSLVPFLSSMVYYVAMAVVVIAVLNLFGIETTSLIAIVGAAGLAIGLAMQGTLSNFAAGVMILLFRPFRIDDWVEIGGTAGSVAEIGIFSTTLNTGDFVRITVPNSAVYGAIIKNYSVNERRRIDLVMGIAYSDDIGKAIETINRVLASEERVLKDPEPTVAVAELADSSVNLVVRPWCKGTDYWPTRRALIQVLKEQLEAAGCNIPFPQRDVHLHNTGTDG
jgi:small conductance mechanosensitive channel